MLDEFSCVHQTGKMAGGMLWLCIHVDWQYDEIDFCYDDSH